MKSIKRLVIIAIVSLNLASFAAAQNDYAVNNTNYNFRAHHQPVVVSDNGDYRRDRPDNDRHQNDRYGNDRYAAEVARENDRLNFLTAHIREDKMNMLNAMNVGDYRRAQHEAGDILNDQRERDLLLSHLYYDGYNWQSDRSRMNAYSDGNSRNAFLRDINHDENDLINALANNDFNKAQRINNHINRDINRDNREMNRNNRRDDRYFERN